MLTVIIFIDMFMCSLHPLRIQLPDVPRRLRDESHAE